MLPTRREHRRESGSNDSNLVSNLAGEAAIHDGRCTIRNTLPLQCTALESTSPAQESIRPKLGRYFLDFPGSLLGILPPFTGFPERMMGGLGARAILLL